MERKRNLSAQQTLTLVITYFVAIFIASCVPKPTVQVVPARLYNLTTAEVINANFNFSGITRGTINFSLPSGEIFQGEYQTITGGSKAWGHVYSTVWGQNTGSGAKGYTEVRPNEYVGSAVATSAQGTLIECEYITNTSRVEPHGQGACKDNKGRTYKLMF